MVDPRTSPSEDSPSDARTEFLSALWDYLEGALNIATLADVFDRLPQIQTYCEQAVALIVQWQARRNS